MKITKTYCSEINQLIQLELHYLCASVRVDVFRHVVCVSRSQGGGVRCLAGGGGWHGLSVAVSPISLVLPVPLAAQQAI